MLKAKLLLATLFFLASCSNVLGQEFEISGNSDSSSSTIEITNARTVEVVQTNTADVENNITITANTGNNTVTESSGNVTIKTGDVVANIKVENTVNTSVNQTAQKQENHNQVAAEIKSNGADSINQIDLKKEDKKVITSSNSAKVENNVETNLNTGGNTASKNAGDVKITSGSVFAHILITNKINSNIAIGGICKKPELPILPHFNNPTQSSSGSSNSSSSSGAVGGGPSVLGLSATSSTPYYYQKIICLMIAALLLKKFYKVQKKI